MTEREREIRDFVASPVYGPDDEDATLLVGWLVDVLALLDTARAEWREARNDADTARALQREAQAERDAAQSRSAYGHEGWRRMEAERDTARDEVKHLKEDMFRHFTEEHLAGDGPEIDRWKAKYRKALADLARLRTANGALLGAAKGVEPMFYGMLCEQWGHPKDWPKPTRDGELTLKQLRAAIAAVEVAEQGPPKEDA